jgi:hypothetical protein
MRSPGNDNAAGGTTGRYEDNIEARQAETVPLEGRVLSCMRGSPSAAGCISGSG